MRSYTNLQTHKERGRNPCSLPAWLLALLQVHLQNTKDLLWSHAALFLSDLSSLGPRISLRKQFHFWPTILGVPPPTFLLCKGKTTMQVQQQSHKLPSLLGFKASLPIVIMMDDRLSLCLWRGWENLEKKVRWIMTAAFEN